MGPRASRRPFGVACGPAGVQSSPEVGMTVMLLISFLPLDAMLAVYLWSMPVPRHGEAFFGVRVVSGHMNEHDRRTLRRYRLALVMSVALIESAAIALIARQTGILRFV